MTLRYIRLVPHLLLCGALAGQNSYQSIPDLVYGVGQDQQGNSVTLRLDLYLPTGTSAPTPCVIWIHGGAWQNGSRFPTQASDLANYGYAVASISYRLSGQNIWPAQLHDCRGAVRWLRANASAYNLDPDRFGAWGTSAGGHLSNMLGVTAGLGQLHIGQETVDLEGSVGGNLGASSEVQAVVDWFGPTDVLRMSQFPSSMNHDAPNSPESLVLGQLLQNNPERADSLSPVTYLWPGAPPTLIMHGTSDSVIPYEQSYFFWRRAVTAYGLDYAFEAVPFAGHGGPAFNAADARAWFDTHLADRDARVSIQSSGAVSEPAGAGSFTVTRTGPLTSPLDVRLAWRGDVEVGADVACMPGVVTIPAGSASVDVAVTVLDDGLIEPDEELRARLRSSTDYLVVAGQAEAGLTVTDDDGAAGQPTVSAVATDRTMAEPGPNPGIVRLTRTGSTAQPLSVDVTVAGVATPGVDHGQVSGQVVIPAGATSYDLIIPVVDDAASEPTELWVVEVQASADYALGAQHVVSGRVLDDDRTGPAPAVCVALDQHALDEAGGVVDVLVTRSRTQGSLTVDLAVAGDATAGSDYAISATTVFFAPNTPEARVTLTGVDDALVEGDEEFVVSVLPAAGYVLGVQPTQKVLIVDDEALPPPQAPAALLGDVVAIGETTCLTVTADPGAVHVVGLALGPGYVPASPYPLLIDPVGIITFGLGVVPAGGAAAVRLAVPDKAALVGSRIWLQSAVVDSGVAFSSRLVRSVVLPSQR